MKNKSGYMMFFIWSLVVMASMVWVPSALAHIEGGQPAGFITGLEHLWSGFDHVLAMIAVGLWGAQLGKPALWVLPITFPIVMALEP